MYHVALQGAPVAASVAWKEGENLATLDRRPEGRRQLRCRNANDRGVDLEGKPLLDVGIGVYVGLVFAYGYLGFFSEGLAAHGVRDAFAGALATSASTGDNDVVNCYSHDLSSIKEA